MVNEYKKFIIKKRFVSKFYNYIDMYLHVYSIEKVNYFFLSYFKEYYPKLVKKKKVYVSGIGKIILTFNKQEITYTTRTVDEEFLKIDKDLKLCSIILLFIRFDGANSGHANSIVINHKLKKYY